MKTWVLGGMFWAAVVGGVLVFAPRKPSAPPAGPAPAGATAVPAHAEAPPPADAVVNVVDLASLLDPPVEPEPILVEAADRFHGFTVSPVVRTGAGGEFRTVEQAVRHAVETGEGVVPPPIPPAAD